MRSIWVQKRTVFSNLVCYVHTYYGLTGLAGKVQTLSMKRPKPPIAPVPPSQESSDDDDPSTETSFQQRRVQLVQRWMKPLRAVVPRFAAKWSYQFQTFPTIHFHEPFFLYHPGSGYYHVVIRSSSRSNSEIVTNEEDFQRMALVDAKTDDVLPNLIADVSLFRFMYPQSNVPETPPVFFCFRRTLPPTLLK